MCWRHPDAGYVTLVMSLYLIWRDINYVNFMNLRPKLASNFITLANTPAS